MWSESTTLFLNCIYSHWLWVYIIYETTGWTEESETKWCIAQSGWFEFYLNIIWIDSTRVHFFELIEWHTTFSDGCLGSHNDEERSEMRYVMRIARPRESLILWTHIALPGNSWEHAYLSVSELLSASSHIMIVVLFVWRGWILVTPVVHWPWTVFLLQDMTWRD